MLAIAIVGLASVSACSSRAQHGTVTGTLSLTGAPSPGVSLPLAGTVTLTRSYPGVYENGPSPEQPLVEIAVADDGAFSVDVPPGRYSVEGRSPSFGDGAVPCFGGLVRVTSSVPVSADVVCVMK